MLPNKSAPSAADILAVVARSYGVTHADIRSESHERRYTTPRHVAMWLIRDMFPDASLPWIGRAVGYRHHTSVMHACKNVEKWRSSNPEEAEPFLAGLRAATEAEYLARRERAVSRPVAQGSMLPEGR